MLQKPIQSEDEQLDDQQETVVEDEEVIVHPDDVQSEEDEPLVHPEELELEVQAQNERQNEVVEPDVVTALREELAALRAELNASRTSDASSSKELDIPYVVDKITGMSFVNENEDVTDLTMSAAGLNEFGERILNAAVQAAITHAYSIAANESGKAVASYAYSREFYDRYPELRGHGELVEEKSKEIEKEKPGIKPQELFLETAKRAYAKIGRKMPVSSAGKRVPGFTQATTATTIGQPSSKVKTTAQDVQDLLRHKGVLK